MIRKILLLGDPRLYEVCTPVAPEEFPALQSAVTDLQDTLLDFRARTGFGRAIAAPQIGVMKRLIYLNAGTPTAIFNPVMEFPDDELMEVMDDCMSFPGLLVKVLRHRRCVLRYQDADGKAQVMELEGDFSELLQHEYDHLDGILAVMRAIDSRSYFFKEALSAAKLSPQETDG